MRAFRGDALVSQFGLWDPNSETIFGTSRSLWSPTPGVGLRNGLRSSDLGVIPVQALSFGVTSHARPRHGYASRSLLHSWLPLVPPRVENVSFSLRKCVLRHAVGSGSQGAGFCATCIASCIALLTARDTEPGELQLRSSPGLSAPERRAVHFRYIFAAFSCAGTKGFRASARSSASGIGNAGLRRPCTPLSRSQPVRRPRPRRGLQHGWRAERQLQ